ncbi:hypothetical protein KPSA1_02255 [Pseudomonas syringae pv. actinidiae]|uniref:Uncharacterized protein n=1 Tax=Pseudomonas syringae pv. actinidiae TaxID=103796 RepID=A0A2V0Q7R0_PSESF|nr:hypothetical protein KPSA1_02255 [Pseudomonas syringae pv. actinidiae]
MNEDQPGARLETAGQHLIMQGQQRLAGVQRLKKYAALHFASGNEIEQGRVGSGETATAGVEQNTGSGQVRRGFFLRPSGLAQHSHNVFSDPRIIRHRHRAIHRMRTRLGQQQTGHGGARPGSQPPAVVVIPACLTELAIDHFSQPYAAQSTGKPAATFCNRIQLGIARLPGLPETLSMSRSITGVAQPVQLHAKGLQVQHRWRLLSMTAQQANRREAEAFARCGQGMQVVGMRATEADHTLRTDCDGLFEVIVELEPFVAADQRIDPVQAQYRNLDPGVLQPGQTQALQHSSGLPAKRVRNHPRSLQAS